MSNGPVIVRVQILAGEEWESGLKLSMMNAMPMVPWALLKLIVENRLTFVARTVNAKNIAGTQPTCVRGTTFDEYEALLIRSYEIFLRIVSSFLKATETKENEKRSKGTIKILMAEYYRESCP
jgi:hypothetical protein